MAKLRMINTKFWSDPWVMTQLNPLDRLLFLYLLTNEHTNISGIYEISEHKISFDTGIERENLVKVMFPRLEPKIFFKNNWVILVNFPKHQNLKSADVVKGILREFESAPKEVQEEAISRGWGDGLGMMPDTKLNLTKLKKDFAKPKSPPSEVVIEVAVESPVKSSRDTRALSLREKLYDILFKENGVRPTPNMGDYKQVQKALKHLTEAQVTDMVETAISLKTVATVRGVLTDREIDIYRQENL